MTTVFTTSNHDTTLCHSPTEMIEETRFNGWKNYETWNVALYIQNDEGLYNLAKSYRRLGYAEFAEMMKEEFGSYETPDAVAWTDSALDYDELNEMMEDL